MQNKFDNAKKFKQKLNAFLLVLPFEEVSL